MLKLNYSYKIPEKAMELQCHVLGISRPGYERRFVRKGYRVTFYNHHRRLQRFKGGITAYVNNRQPLT